MIKNIVFSVATGILAFLSAPTFAQQAHHPQIVFGQKGIGQLKSDVKFLLNLTSPEDQKQEQNIVDFIDLIAFGLDEDRPLRVDYHSGNTPPTYLIWAPVDDFNDLQDNIESNFTIKKVAEDLFEVLPPDNGWYRTLRAVKYAMLILTNPADHQLMKQLIQKMTNPDPELAELIEGGKFDIGLSLANEAQTKEDQQKRAASFREIRAVRMDALQKRPNEEKTEFEIRKGVVATQLDELERLMVEASEALLRLAVDRTANNTTVTFNAKGIAGTSFAEAADLFGKHKDAFTAIKKPDESVLSVRMNHPVDDMRKKNAAKVIELMTADAEAKIDAASKLSASEKEAAKKIHVGVMELARESIETGNINAFLEVVLDDNEELVGWGAFSVKDGERLNELLKLVPEAGEGNKFDPAVATVNGIAIHRVSVADGYSKVLDKLFGQNGSAYLGVSNDYIWVGTGPDALEPLKKAIASATPPADSDVILTMEGRLLPWAKRVHKLVEEMPSPTTAEDKQLRRDNLRRLAQGIEAFQSGDEATFEMQVENGEFAGKVFLNTGVLRFVGMLLAQFSRDTLQ